jgi:hypothetical protein
VKKAYRTIGKQGKVNEQELASFLVKNGQGFLPMVDLIEQCQVACKELIDVTGRAAIQAVLQLSAMEAAGGPPQQGRRRSGDVVFYGRQAGQVLLSDRKLEVNRPRLRSRGPGSQEVSEKCGVPGVFPEPPVARHASARQSGAHQYFSGLESTRAARQKGWSKGPRADPCHHASDRQYRSHALIRASEAPIESRP